MKIILIRLELKNLNTKFPLYFTLVVQRGLEGEHADVDGIEIDPNKNMTVQMKINLKIIFLVP